VALTATAVLLAVSGGFRATVGGLRISARSPIAAAIAALVLGAIWLVIARREQALVADLEASWRAIERHADRATTTVALLVAIVAGAFFTHSAAGADASGYLSQAALWASGHLFHADSLAPLVAGRDAWLTSPLGWRPALDAGLQVPTYPPGLPLLMALPHALGGVLGASTVVIVSAAIAVLATGALAARLAGGVAGMVAAIALGFSPVFLFQSIQPMSDVPVTAAWMACFYLAFRDRTRWAGVVCALAVLIRPNLAPLAIVPLLIARHRVAFSIPVAIAGVFLATLQWLWYGSPLRSGYGAADELFSLANAGTNATHYFSWLIATSPVLLLSVFGFLRLKQNATARAMGVFAALVIAAYLVYAVFDEWSYLRFLLPAMAVFAVFTAVELAAWIERRPTAVRAPLLVALVVGLAAHGLWVARSLDTFRLGDQLRRVAQVADFIDRSVPATAIVVAGEQSGSMRYYTGRPILRWDAASPQAASAAIGALEHGGQPIYFVLDAWENEPFRAKFSSVPAAALDWPPAIEAGSSHRTRLWNLADRGRFLKGENITTIRLP